MAIKEDSRYGGPTLKKKKKKERKEERQKERKKDISETNLKTGRLISPVFV